LASEYHDCIAIKSTDAERTLKILRLAGLLTNLKPRRLESNELAVPVNNVERAISALLTESVSARPCKESFDTRERPTRLSDEVPGLSGFLIIGSIVLLNYNSSIGIPTYVRAAEAISRMHPRVTSVFLKLGTTGELRLPQLVLIYGDGNTLTITKESGLRLYVDVAKTYFNPRLSGERLRISSLVESGERVLDMFCGVAPFSLLIASRRRASVVANDLNPYAAALAGANARLNRKLLKGNVTITRSDASALPSLLKGGFDRIIMNNPTSSPKFIEAACQLSLTSGSLLHVYYLAESEDLAIRTIAEEASRTCKEFTVLSSRKAIEYSPSKSIYVVDLEVKGYAERPRPLSL
jgi:tRNA (guanine37-N1)-methyltransferase